MAAPVDADHISENIDWIARVVNNRALFRHRAFLVAREFGASMLPVLPAVMELRLDPPADLSSEFSGVGDWQDARYQALFELVYHTREAGLPFLHPLAFGDDEWIQRHAITTLCRLGEDGIHRIAIARALADALPGWSSSLIRRVMEPIGRFAPLVPTLHPVIHKLVSDWYAIDPLRPLDLLEPLVWHAPMLAAEHWEKLVFILRRHGRGVKRPTVTGQVFLENTDDGKIGFKAVTAPIPPVIPDEHAIRAALIMHAINPNDAEVLLSLREWSMSHPDEHVRNAIWGQLRHYHPEAA